MPQPATKPESDIARRAEQRPASIQLLFPVSVGVRFDESTLFVEVVNYHHKGACLRFQEVPPDLLARLTSQEAVLDFYLGKKKIRSGFPYRLAWQSLALDKTAGIEFLSDSTERFVRPPRYFAHPEFTPQVSCPDPLDPNRTLFFKVSNLSETGMLLLSSLTNKHLLPGLSLKGATLSIPGQENTSLSLYIANTRRSEVQGMFELGVAVEDNQATYAESARKYISVLSPGTSDADLNDGGMEPLLFTKRVKQGLSYRIIDNQRDYESVLKLRFQAYGAHGKVKTGTRWQDQGEGLAHEGVVLGGFLGSRLVSTVELRFGDQGIPFRLNKYLPHGSIPVANLAKTVEINKLAVHATFQGSDILVGMFQKMHSIFVARGGYDVVITATQKLAPLYVRLGFKKTDTTFPHPYLADQPLSLLVLPKEFYLEAKQINPVAWVTVYEATQKHMESLGLGNALNRGLKHSLLLFIGKKLAPFVSRKKNSKRPQSSGSASRINSTDHRFINPKWTSQHIVAPIIKPYLLEGDAMVGARQIDQILSEIGVSRAFFNRHGNWASIAFLDEFLDRFSALGSIAELSRRAGERSLEVDQIGYKHFFLKHFLTVSQAMGASEKVLPKFNLTRSYRVFDLRKNHCKISVGTVAGMPLPKHKESCLNWEASFGKYFKIMTGTVGKVRKLSCVYSGDEACTYQLDWTQSQRVLPLAVAVGGLIPVVIVGGYASQAYLTREVVTWFGPALIALSSLAMAVRELFLRRKDSRAFTEHFERLEQESSEKYSELQSAKTTLDDRYREARLLEETAKAIQASSDLSTTLNTSLKAICTNFDFDRAFVMLADEQRTALRTAAVFTKGAPIEPLWKFQVDISKVREGAFFLSTVYHTGNPVLIDNVETHLFQLNETSQKLIKALETRGFIMVPIPSEIGRWGVLIADKVSPQKPLDRPDLTLLQRVSQHLGIALDKQSKLDHERGLRQLFQKYVPSQILDRLGSGSVPELGGQIRTIHCLFLDIRDFTSLSEKLPPQVTLDVLNRLFNVVQDIVSAHGGWIDKFLGDGALITWGTLGAGPTSPESPARAALEILSAVEDLNRVFVNEGLRALRLGMGLNSGPAIVGNIGALTRMEFTSIGRTVNVAARLEALCKELDACFVVSENILESLSPSTRQRFREVAETSIRGLEKPIRVGYLPREKS